MSRTSSEVLRGQGTSRRGSTGRLTRWCTRPSRQRPGVSGDDGRNDMRAIAGESRSRPRRGHCQVAAGVASTALLIAGCWSMTPVTPTWVSTTPLPGPTAGSPALKPITQAVLQSTVDTTARELLVPGAVVVLRTPQGE